MSDVATPSGPPVAEETGERTVDEALAQELVERARSEGVELVGPGGLLTGLTKTVLETALEAEIDEHLGYPKHAVEGRGSPSRWSRSSPPGSRGRSTRSTRSCSSTRSTSRSATARSPTALSTPLSASR